MDQENKIQLVKFCEDDEDNLSYFNVESDADFVWIGEILQRLQAILAETRKPEPIIVVHCRLVESLEKLILELER